MAVDRGRRDTKTKPRGCILVEVWIAGKKGRITIHLVNSLIVEYAFKSTSYHSTATELFV